MKKAFVLLALSVSLVGCGSGTVTDQGKEAATTTESTTPTESTTSTEGAAQNKEGVYMAPVPESTPLDINKPAEEGVLGQYKVEFGTAKKVTSEYESGDLLMVTYTFTNNSNKAMAADTATMLTAYQDGVEIDQAFDSSLTEDNASKSIKPGVSLECKALFKLTSSSEVEATEFLGLDDSKVTKTFTVQ